MTRKTRRGLTPSALLDVTKQDINDPLNFGLLITPPLTLDFLLYKFYFLLRHPLKFITL